MIVIAKYAGTSLADDNGLAAGQTAGTGGAALVLNGSLTSGGVWSNPGWGYKVKLVCAGNETGKSVSVTGKFYASTSVGDYTTTISLAGSNAGSTTSALYAGEVTGWSIDTLTASSMTLGLAADGHGLPVGLNHGSLYQFCYGGTFGGATLTVARYAPVTNEWITIGSTTAALVENYEFPAGTILKAAIASGSTTTSLGISAEIINKQR